MLEYFNSGGFKEEYSMKYKEKINFKILWLIILFSPIIVATLVSINILDIPTSNDWIGFYAAIFGGLLGGLFTFHSMYLSMSGVREQINEQKEANNLLKAQFKNDNEMYREEQRLNVRPYINEYSGAESSVIDYKAYIFEVHYDDYIYTDDMVIKIKNIGNGPLISLCVMGIRDCAGDGKLCEPEHQEVKSLEIGGVMNLHVSYMTKTSYSTNTLDIEVQYFDILDNHYRQILNVQTCRDGSGAYEKCKIDSISKQELIINTKSTD